jgi:glutamine synthetase
MQKVCAEYVWVDSDGNLRSKTKVLTYQPTTITGNGNGNDGNDGNDGDDGDDPLPDVVDHLPLLLSDLPKWNFDGSSTGQAEGHYSEIDLKPVKLIPCPFKKGDNILVLCECYNPNGTPAVGNNRFTYVATFASENVSNEKPWFGIEQEYTLMGNDRLGQTHHNRPFAWTLHKKIGRQGPYYCSTGSSKAIGR